MLLTVTHRLVFSDFGRPAPCWSKPSGCIPLVPGGPAESRFTIGDLISLGSAFNPLPSEFIAVANFCLQEFSEAQFLNGEKNAPRQ